MPNPVLGLLGAGALGLGGAAIQSSAASKASNQQTQLGYDAISEQKAAREAMAALLKPYVDAGGPALQQQMALLGLGPAGSQEQAIAAQENSPFFQALARQGEDAILQNASATGGLRGGNTQGALAQFRPALLNQFIADQYNRLGGLTQLGQNSAAGVGSAGMNTATNISSILGDIGAAKAGNTLAQGQAWGNALSGFSGTLGTIGRTAGWF